jgi:hypothetical protein
MNALVRFTAAALAVTLIAARPGGGAPAPMPHAAPMPAPRAMPMPARPMPSAPRAPSGFHFPNSDINTHPIAPRPAVRSFGVRPMVGGYPVVGGSHPFYRSIPPGYHGPGVNNPRHWGNWGWNHGVMWYPAPLFWGGGFWGAWALASLSNALLFGTIVDYQYQVIYPSYQVQPLTPGAQLLQDYGLTQTPCGPPNLVVIWGPGDSVICAQPNSIVGPGNYDVDPTSLTLVTPPQPSAAPLSPPNGTPPPQ